MKTALNDKPVRRANRGAEKELRELAATLTLRAKELGYLVTVAPQAHDRDNPARLAYRLELEWIG